MLKDKEEKTYEFNLISNQCRFGYGFRTKEGSKQYFAFHGIPRGNSDYFTNVQISEDEYLRDKETMEGGQLQQPRGRALQAEIRGGALSAAQG